MTLALDRVARREVYREVNAVVAIDNSRTLALTRNLTRLKAILGCQHTDARGYAAVQAVTLDVHISRSIAYIAGSMERHKAAAFPLYPAPTPAISDGSAHVHETTNVLCVRRTTFLRAFARILLHPQLEERRAPRIPSLLTGPDCASGSPFVASASRRQQATWPQTAEKSAQRS